MPFDRRGFLRLAAGAVVVGGGAAAYRVLEHGGGSPVEGDVRAFVSRPDLRPPRVTVLHGGDTANGLLFMAPSEGPGQRGTLIADDTGEPVWFHPTSSPAMNFRPAVYQGRPVLTWWQGSTAHGLGDGTHIVVDRSYRELLRFPAGHGLPSDLHELQLTPQGTALVTSYQDTNADLTAFGGARNGRVIGGIVQELELATGKVLFEWRSLDHVALDESHAKLQDPWDYFHVNSIDVAADGNLIVSARNTWGVYKLDRSTGNMLWRLGGKRSDFALGPGVRFAWQHDAREHDDGRTLTLFDDGARPQVEKQSRALVLALDERNMRAALARSYTHQPSVLAVALGSMQVLPNGNVLVGWGTAPYVTEYSSDGHVLFDARLPVGGQNYRAYRLQWTGEPAEPPRLAASVGGLYASWNGATEVDAWQLESGSGATRLDRVATTPRQGFETRLAAPAGVRYARAVALGARGRALGTSAVVAV
ncbi:MAG TPA: arylsulfotransferase family protein [Gaiellaceae bacterium]